MDPNLVFDALVEIASAHKVHRAAFLAWVASQPLRDELDSTSFRLCTPTIYKVWMHGPSTSYARCGLPFTVQRNTDSDHDRAVQNTIHARLAPSFRLVDGR